jgi:hypothetical protein
MKRVSTTALVIAVIALESARAQAPNGAIIGVITDPTGKAVQGAKVSAINRAIGSV